MINTQATIVRKPKSGPRHLGCTEIWGGNRAANRTLRTPGLEIRLISKPVGECGGDMHFVSVCEGGVLTRILLADVSGHGPRVSRFADELRALARRYISIDDQSCLVASLNDCLRSWSSSGRFATVLVGTYRADMSQLTLTNAGHPRPLLFRASSGQWDLFDATGPRRGDSTNLPLGISGNIAYATTSLELEVGDAFVFYTDLLTDTRGCLGDRLGEEGVLNTVRRIHDPSDRSPVAQDLLDEIVDGASSDSPADDGTVIEFRRTADSI